MALYTKGRRFEPHRRRFFTPTPAESLPNLNPAFLLSASRPFNRWPSVWFGSMLYGISMRPKYPGYWRRRALMTNDGKPSLLPLHYKLSSPKRDPLGRHLQYTPNIASLDHLTENVHNVLGQIWQATRQSPKYNK